MPRIRLLMHRILVSVGLYDFYSCSIVKLLVTVWRNHNGVPRINEVTLRRARLVLGWVNVCGCTVTSANSAFYPPRDWEWVPAKGQWLCSEAPTCRCHDGMSASSIYKCVCLA